MKPDFFGLYLHIPFCRARCGYCDFVTFTGQEAVIERYVNGLIHELALLSEQEGTSRLSTIFFGGGTPSILSGEQVDRILSAAAQRWRGPWDEVTLEANPESVTSEKAAAWRRAGVTRLSIGLQSFDDELLQKMGRLHTAEAFCRAYQTARDAGFSNINIDLIYGFEGQTLDGWAQTLERCVRLKPQHLSLYALTIEGHTPFAAQGYAVDADRQAEMYERARRMLSQEGFCHYEISNFAKPGKECRHNLIYWRQQPYLGAGVGAVGCLDDRRWQVCKDFQSYFRALDNNELPWSDVEHLSVETQRFERLMLGLRLREGLPWANEKNPRWLDERRKLQEQGLLEEIRPGAWRIPDAAVGLTNQVLLPFVDGNSR